VAAPAPKGEEISIRRSEIPIPTAEGPPKAVIYITYSTKDLPPGLITIPKEEWTAAKEAELIKKDLEVRRKAKALTVRI
jgi:hypothetical protein